MTPKVLVADGDGDLCDLYRLFFSRQGWRVRLAANALECLTELRQSLPHVLILDLQLDWGGADGLLDLIREDEALAGVPVILTSTDHGEDGLTRFVSPPVVQALLKPFSMIDLLEIVRSRMERK